MISSLRLAGGSMVAHTRARNEGKAPDAKVFFVENTSVECTGRPRSVEQSKFTHTLVLYLPSARC